MTSDKYTFTICDSDAYGLENFLIDHQYYLRYYLTTKFPTKMSSADQFFNSTGHKYIDESIDIVRVPNMGWKVTICKTRE